MNDYDELQKKLHTPEDWNTIAPHRKADIIALSFIGMIARPTNIPKGLLKKCAVAFEKNRGKIEREVEAIQEVLDKELA